MLPIAAATTVYGLYPLRPISDWSLFSSPVSGLTIATKDFMTWKRMAWLVKDGSIASKLSDRTGLRLSGELREVFDSHWLVLDISSALAMSVLVSARIQLGYHQGSNLTQLLVSIRDLWEVVQLELRLNEHSNLRVRRSPSISHAVRSPGSVGANDDYDEEQAWLLHLQATEIAADPVSEESVRDEFSATRHAALKILGAMKFLRTK